jgi:hypothetical protein
VLVRGDSIPIEIVLVVCKNHFTLSQVLVFSLLPQDAILIYGLFQVFEHASLGASNQEIVCFDVVVLTHLFKFVKAKLLKLQVSLINALELNLARYALILELVEIYRGGGDARLWDFTLFPSLDFFLLFVTLRS